VETVGGRVKISVSHFVAQGTAGRTFVLAVLELQQSP